jgi:hypothetical protein
MLNPVSKYISQLILFLEDFSLAFSANTFENENF